MRDLNHMHVKEGYVILDQGSLDKLNAAIAAGSGGIVANDASGGETQKDVDREDTVMDSVVGSAVQDADSASELPNKPQDFDANQATKLSAPITMQ